MDWIEFKNYLSQVSDLHQDALHIYASVLVQFTAAAVLRRSLASLWPWMCVLIVLLANEYWDMFSPGDPVEEWQLLGGVKDLWNTMALPTCLLLIARLAPFLLVPRTAPAPERDPSEQRGHTIPG